MRGRHGLATHLGTQLEHTDAKDTLVGAVGGQCLILSEKNRGAEKQDESIGAQRSCNDFEEVRVFLLCRPFRIAAHV